jgi:DNA polymerase III delta prime subunit
MQGNTMNFKYNPGFSSDEDLIDAFVVRQKELQQILQTIQENTGRTYQHLLLVGARGTGKTMLVRRVAAEIRRSPELNQHWYPLVFGEESYRILSAGEFWLEALNHLAAQNPGSQWQGVYEELRGERDEKRLQQRAIAKLMDFADAQNKQILLIVENLNMLFDEQMSAGDDWDLRHTLQNEPRLMLLGTATQRFDEIDNVDKAWFEFFALHTMELLNLNECRQLWSSVANEDLTDNQIRPMQILTGGNPRLLRILAGFAQGMSFRDLMANLTQLIDSHTDYFKGLLEVLPATERRVFVELLEFWKPASASQVASAARMEVSKTSALLNRLLKRGAIESVEQQDKKKYYQVSERLFNIYYLMRKRGEREGRVKTTIDFLSVFYSDLLDVTEKIIEGLDTKSIFTSNLKDHYLAIAYVKEILARNNSHEELAQILDKCLISMNTFHELLEITIRFASIGNDNANLILNALIERRIELDLEPLIVGLRIFLGEEHPLVAQEILEVGKDIADRIRGKQADESRKELELVQLFVGLKIFLGEEPPLVTQEILEVGKDIADRIRGKQAELANPSDITTQ